MVKTKIAIKKITKKSSLGPICVKRRNGLFSKASQFCLLSGGQMAILATPLSSEFNIAFHSFGHSSVDGVVSAFLSGQRPVSAPNPEDDKEMREDVGIPMTRKKLGLGFWWNDERLLRSEDSQEISEAIDSMRTLLSNLKELCAEEAFVGDDHEDLKNNETTTNDVVLDRATQEPDQTLNHLQSSTTSPICCIPHVIDDHINDITEEQDQIHEITEEQDQIFSLCQSFNNNNSFPEQVNLDFDQELDIDQLIGFDTNFESSLDDCFYDNTHQETTASVLTNSESVYDHAWMETTNPNLFSEFEALGDANLMLEMFG